MRLYRRVREPAPRGGDVRAAAGSSASDAGRRVWAVWPAAAAVGVLCAWVIAHSVPDVGLLWGRAPIIRP
jgi:hypothetical protein